jgi:hypothetical protein
VPYDCGLVADAHPAAHRAALSLGAHYIQATGAERDPHEFTPEESRRARAVPVYAAMRVARPCGPPGSRRALLRARPPHGDRRLAEEPRFRILNDVVLNQVLVKCLPADGRRRVPMR